MFVTGSAGVRASGPRRGWCCWRLGIRATGTRNGIKRKLGPDYEIRYPRVPNEADPNYRTWKAALHKEFATLDDDALLVGHSLGGTILVKAIVEEPNQRAFGGISSSLHPLWAKAAGQAKIWNCLPISVQDCPHQRRSIFIMEATTTRYRSVTLSFMRELFRKLSCAGSRVATIKSMRTCQKSLPISGGVSNTASAHPHL